MNDKKKRLIILIASAIAVLVVFSIIVLASNDVACIDVNFGCACKKDDENYNGYLDACFITKHKGVHVSGDCIDCEWYPLLCGAEVVKEGGYSCINPILCGYGLCTNGFVSYNPNIGTILPESNDMPIYADKREVLVGTDIIIMDEQYELIDKHGNRTTYKSFESLVESVHFASMKDEFYSYNSSKAGSFTIRYSCSIESNYNFDLKSTMTVTRGFINYIDSDFTGTSTNKINIGTNLISISVECKYVDFYMSGNFGLGDTTINSIKHEGTVLDFRSEE